MERYRKFSAVYVERAWAVRQHFRAIESAPLAEVSAASKARAMRDWWTIALALIVEERPTRGTLHTILRELTNFQLRDGAARFLRLMHAKGVPVTLLSAGIGDMIVLMLQRADLLLPNIKICRCCGARSVAARPTTLPPPRLAAISPASNPTPTTRSSSAGCAATSPFTR